MIARKSGYLGQPRHVPSRRKGRQGGAGWLAEIEAKWMNGGGIDRGDDDREADGMTIAKQSKNTAKQKQSKAEDEVEKEPNDT